MWSVCLQFGNIGFSICPDRYCNIFPLLILKSYFVWKYWLHSCFAVNSWRWRQFIIVILLTSLMAPWSGRYYLIGRYRGVTTDKIQLKRQVQLKRVFLWTCIFPEASWSRDWSSGVNDENLTALIALSHDMFINTWGRVWLEHFKKKRKPVFCLFVVFFWHFLFCF